ncbi:hypothetical protein ACMYYO_00975 [Dermacoccaceae bacterium W4C1]
MSGLRGGDKVEIKGRRLTGTPLRVRLLERARPVLIDHARRGTTITYGELAQAIEFTQPVQAIGRLLDLITEDCRLRGEPSLAALAVNSQTGEVGDDFDGEPVGERALVYAHRWLAQ